MNIDPQSLLDSFGLGNSASIQLLHYGGNDIAKSSTITTCIPGTYPTGHYGKDVYTTVYTTEYIQVCPTETPCPKGTKTDTYTITETCTGDKSYYTRPPLPPHFTTTVTVCDVCDGKPTITVTCPQPKQTDVWSGYGKNEYPQAVDNKSGAGSNGYPQAVDNNSGVSQGGYPYGTSDNSGQASTGDYSGAGAAPAGDNARVGYPAANDNNTADTYKKYEGYTQSNIASSGRTEITAALLGSFIGIVAWLL